MRDIIFRGKRKDNGEWIEGSLILTTSTMEKPFIVDGCWCYSDSVDDEGYAIFEYLNAYEVIPETVGQDTGLTDKNGKNVFEGDLVRCRLYETVGVTYTVEYNIERKGYYPFACGDGCGCCEEETVTPGYTEIIGNIHDNPELLKGGG